MPAPTANKDRFNATIIAAAEIGDTGDTWFGDSLTWLQRGNKSASYISAQKAFRLNSLLSATPQMNVAGNLRGMVVSKAWHHVFDLTIKYGKYLDRAQPVADFLGAVGYFTDWASEINSTVRSSDPWSVKGARLSFFATTAATHLLTKTAHGINDSIITAAQGACWVGSKTGLVNLSDGQSCSSYADIARASVNSYYQSIDEAVTPENIQKAVVDTGGPAVYRIEDWYDSLKGIIRTEIRL